MTRDRVTADAHASDGVLLAVHDREPVDAPEALAHIDACPECQARLQRIRVDAERVRSALAAVPVPSFDAEALRRSLLERRRPIPARPPWRRPAIQVVAALALATAAAASVGPIRTLIAHRNAPVAVPPAPAAPTSVLQPVPRAGTLISFPEPGPEFTVRFDSTPYAGDLEIDRGATGAVSAQAITLGDVTGDAMVVLPHELRLRNGAASTASYRIMIPGSVERVRVVVAGRLLFDGALGHARIALSPGRRK